MRTDDLVFEVNREDVAAVLEQAATLLGLGWSEPLAVRPAEGGHEFCSPLDPAAVAWDVLGALQAGAEFVRALGFRGGGLEDELLVAADEYLDCVVFNTLHARGQEPMGWMSWLALARPSQDTVTRLVTRAALELRAGVEQAPRTWRAQA